MTFIVIGAPGAAEYFETGEDPCFGKAFARSTPQCIECRAPVLVDGRILLMRELCVMRMRGAQTPMQLHHLTSRDVLQRLERGESLPAIFAEILGDAAPDLMASTARQLLVDRVLYLRSTGMTIGDVPRVKEMLKKK